MAYREIAIDSGYYGGEPEPYDDPEPYLPDEIAQCPNCGTWTAELYGVEWSCTECGALWESTAGILTEDEERAMWAQGARAE